MRRRWLLRLPRPDLTGGQNREYGDEKYFETNSEHANSLARCFLLGCLCPSAPLPLCPSYFFFNAPNIPPSRVPSFCLISTATSLPPLGSLSTTLSPRTS